MGYPCARGGPIVNIVRNRNFELLKLTSMNNTWIKIKNAYT